MTMFIPEIIIVTSDEPWCEIWHTQLHYTYQLSKKYMVYFVGPPAPWNPLNIFFNQSDVIRISDSLTILTYSNYLPVRFGRIAMRINDFLNELRIRKIAGKNLVGKNLLMWRFDHFRGYFLFRKQKKRKELFHVIDPITNSQFNELFSGNADLVVVTSPKFIDFYRSLNPNTMLIPQGIDLDAYHNSITDNSIHGVAAESIVLLGTLTDAVDYSLLFRISEQFPGQLIIIGPDKVCDPQQRLSWVKLRDSGNIHWLGAMSPVEFIPYIKVSRLGLICYSSTGIANNNLRSPLKVISYIAAGKPVISNIDCEIPELENLAIHIVKNTEEMLEKVSLAMSDTVRFDKPTVNAYLNKILYHKLIGQIIDRLSDNVK